MGHLKSKNGYVIKSYSDLDDFLERKWFVRGFVSTIDCHTGKTASAFEVHVVLLCPCTPQREHT